MNTILLQARFWSKVDVKGMHDCWEWRAAVNSSNYGIFNHKDTGLAHRMAFMFFHGQIEDGKEICHLCDNTLCVNPQHLFSGTHEENMRDMAIKGRVGGPCLENKEKLFCINGHEFNLRNTGYIKKKNRPGIRQRYCRVCDKNRKRVIK